MNRVYGMTVAAIGSNSRACGEITPSQDSTSRPPPKEERIWERRFQPNSSSGTWGRRGGADPGGDGEDGEGRRGHDPRVVDLILPCSPSHLSPCAVYQNGLAPACRGFDAAARAWIKKRAPQGPAFLTQIAGNSPASADSGNCDESRNVASAARERVVSQGNVGYL
jgi:hypothetical protein